MKNKLIALLLTFLLLAPGCGNSEAPSNSTSKSSSSNTSISPVYETGSIEKELQDYAVDVIAENYSNIDINSISINQDLGTEEDSDYIILVNLTWNQKNSASTSKEVLALYSEDFAARIGSGQSLINEISIFWTVPYLDNATAKWSYEKNGNGMYLSDNMMDSIFDE